MLEGRAPSHTPDSALYGPASRALAILRRLRSQALSAQQLGAAENGEK